jgi:hypothetical protein
MLVNLSSRLHIKARARADGGHSRPSLPAKSALVADLSTIEEEQEVAELGLGLDCLD